MSDSLQPIVEALVKEQRKSRRWGIFFKLMGLLYVAIFLVVLWPKEQAKKVSTKDSFTAVIDIQGQIVPDADSNADAVISGLRSAFEAKGTEGVVIRINSPGGTPVQAAYINDEIYRLKEANPDIPVYAVIQDLGASGAYYVAVAADEIYASRSSLIGSIGVTSSGFGFVGTMKKLGIERREYTAGEHKGFLDPFKPEDKAEKQHWQSVLGSTHQVFVDTVRKGRGDRLSETPDMFSGLIWSGDQAMELGLIDGFGSTSYLAREVIGAEEIVDFTPKLSPVQRLLQSVSTRVGLGIRSGLGLEPAVMYQ